MLNTPTPKKRNLIKLDRELREFADSAGQKSLTPLSDGTLLLHRIQSARMYRVDLEKKTVDPYLTPFTHLSWMINLEDGRFLVRSGLKGDKNMQQRLMIWDDRSEELQTIRENDPLLGLAMAYRFDERFYLWTYDNYVATSTGDTLGFERCNVNLFHRDRLDAPTKLLDYEKRETAAVFSEDPAIVFHCEWGRFGQHVFVVQYDVDDHGGLTERKREHCRLYLEDKPISPTVVGLDQDGHAIAYGHRSLNKPKGAILAWYQSGLFRIDKETAEPSLIATYEGGHSKVIAGEGDRFYIFSHPNSMTLKRTTAVYRHAPETGFEKMGELSGEHKPYACIEHNGQLICLGEKNIFLVTLPN